MKNTLKIFGIAIMLTCSLAPALKAQAIFAVVPPVPVPVPVPDGGHTVALLGLALAGVEVLRRRIGSARKPGA
jgi:VPDSG-CTERM motif